jgi:hypothetical protein
MLYTNAVKLPALTSKHITKTVLIRCQPPNGAYAVHHLQGQTGGSRRVPDLGCEQDGEEQSVPHLRLPHVCASWCEAGHCREGEGRLSCFGYNKLYGRVVAVCLKSPCTVRDALRTRGTEFHNTGTQRLNQRWHNCVENDGNFVEKSPNNCKRCMSYRCKFYCYCNYIF